ncbi:hypothetical protein FRB94_000397 [Tulasnella sp. JGI-2019a]|nr:hypothetical protein FRB94_000397 [Tulasnella sp. JGI-2019a]
MVAIVRTTLLSVCLYFALTIAAPTPTPWGNESQIGITSTLTPGGYAHPHNGVSIAAEHRPKYEPMTMQEALRLPYVEQKYPNRPITRDLVRKFLKRTGIKDPRIIDDVYQKLRKAEMTMRSHGVHGHLGKRDMHGHGHGHGNPDSLSQEEVTDWFRFVEQHPSNIPIQLKVRQYLLTHGKLHRGANIDEEVEEFLGKLRFDAQHHGEMGGGHW